MGHLARTPTVHTRYETPNESTLVKRSPVMFLACVALAACAKKVEQKLEIQTATVGRRTIVLDATASGSVEPINVVEVKSKSSGQITKMTVETGSLVNPGDLLVQLDTRDVQNQYDQSAADLNAAEAKLQVSESQKRRSDDLFKQRIITAQENETAEIDFANSRASGERSSRPSANCRRSTGGRSAPLARRSGMAGESVSRKYDMARVPRSKIQD